MMMMIPIFQESNLWGLVEERIEGMIIVAMVTMRFV